MTIFAEADLATLPTTWGGIALFAVGMSVWNYFQEKKKIPRETTKTENLEQQTVLLKRLVEQNETAARKQRKQAKKSMKILKEVHGTVSDIRNDQKHKASV